MKNDKKLPHRGDADIIVDTNSSIMVLKWMDKRSVLLVSNFVGLNPMGNCERYCHKEKT